MVCEACSLACTYVTYKVMQIASFELDENPQAAGDNPLMNRSKGLFSP